MGHFAIVCALVAGAGCGVEDSDSVFFNRSVELTPEPILVDARAIAWDGDAYATVWLGRLSTTGDETRLFFARLDADGNFVTPPSPLTSDVGDEVNRMWLIPRGTSYTVVMRNDEEIEAFELARDGLTSQRRDIVDNTNEVSVATSGTGLAVLFTDSIDGADPLYFLPEEGGTAIEIGNGSSDYQQAALTWIESQGAYLALYRRSGRLKRAMLNPDGSFAREEWDIWQSPSDLGGLGVAQDGSGNVMIIWNKSSAWAFLAADELGEGIWDRARTPIPRNRAESPDISVAGAGGRFYAAWESDVDTSLPQILGGSIDVNGTGDLENVELLSDSEFGYDRPAVAGDGSGFAAMFAGQVLGGERAFFVPSE
jgi:hypothetical protein